MVGHWLANNSDVVKRQLLVIDPKMASSQQPLVIYPQWLPGIRQLVSASNGPVPAPESQHEAGLEEKVIADVLERIQINHCQDLLMCTEKNPNKALLTPDMQQI